MLFLFLILITMVLLFYGGITYYTADTCDLTASEGFWNVFLDLDRCSLWVVWMLINTWFHLLWVTILTSIQLYQIVLIGMTTNERINRGRYKHFIDLGGKSPFHLGPWSNIGEFFQCTCFGLLKFKRRNWMAFTGREADSLITSRDDDLQYV
jgi:palmitoyltransferase ZDHHC13/17